jgi:hypothetical protein
MVDESTVFGPSRSECFGYSLRVSRESRELSASFADRRLIVRIPAAVADQWATTDQVGVSCHQRTTDDSELSILIEKDFECVDAPSGESHEDAFPNPQFEAVCQPAMEIERSM